jgi:hypothetical protein
MTTKVNLTGPPGNHQSERMLPKRLSAISSEVKSQLRLRALRHRERRALIGLGARAARGGNAEGTQAEQLVVQVSEAERGRAELEAAIAASTQTDRADFVTAPRWLRPVVVVRGLCTRGILRQRITSINRNLTLLHEALGRAVIQSSGGRVDGADLRAVAEERDRMVASLGESALPAWLPRLRTEIEALGRAFWHHLRPNVLPRFSALAGLVVGWWIADTYTDSHFRSVLHSVGIGKGGHRVVSGETYRAMLFWLPIMAAAICAYLADRAQALLQRHYVPQAPDESDTTPA